MTYAGAGEIQVSNRLRFAQNVLHGLFGQRIVRQVELFDVHHDAVVGWNFADSVVAEIDEADEEILPLESFQRRGFEPVVGQNDVLQHLQPRPLEQRLGQFRQVIVVQVHQFDSRQALERPLTQPLQLVHAQIQVLQLRRVVERHLADRLQVVPRQNQLTESRQSREVELFDGFQLIVGQVDVLKELQAGDDGGGEKVEFVVGRDQPLESRMDAEGCREQIAQLVVGDVELFQAGSGVENFALEGAQLVSFQRQGSDVHGVDESPGSDGHDVVE